MLLINCQTHTNFSRFFMTSSGWGLVKTNTSSFRLIYRWKLTAGARLECSWIRGNSWKLSTVLKVIKKGSHKTAARCRTLHIVEQTVIVICIYSRIMLFRDCRQLTIATNVVFHETYHHIRFTVSAEFCATTTILFMGLMFRKKIWETAVFTDNLSSVAFC